MYSFLMQAHADWRYLVLLVLGVSLVKYLVGWLRGSSWGRPDQILGTATTIVVDIQLLIGLALWGVAMSQGLLGQLGRVRAFEHPITMLVAIAVMHLGWSRARRQAQDRDRFRWATLAFLVAGLLILLGINLVTRVS